MEIKIKKTIGNNEMEVVVDEKSDEEALAKATFFLQPDYCGLCNKTNIVWTSNKAETDSGTFTYIKRKCLMCGAASTMGKYKVGGYFWKQWEIYKGTDGVSHEDLGMSKKK